MKKIITSIALLFAAGFVNQSEAQSVAINSTGNVADTSALLDLTSTAKGILVPRMTAAQKALIYQPATGLMVFQTDATAGFYYNSGTSASPVWTLLQTSLANVTTQGNTFNGASQLVQMTASTKLPAVDGSALTNLTASNLTTGTVPDARLSTNVTVQGNTFNGASQLVQMTASTKLPAVDGSALTNLNGSNVASGTVADARLSSNVTVQGNTFNAANKLVQLDGSSKLPAVDGSQLTNLPTGTFGYDIQSIASGGSYTVNSATNVRYVIINCGGSTSWSGTFNLPAANAYSAGTIIHLNCVNYSTNQPALTITSSSTIISTTTSGTSLNANQSQFSPFNFFTNGTNWYRI